MAGHSRLHESGRPRRVDRFYGLNGRRLTLTYDEAYELVIAVSTGVLDTVTGISEGLRAATESSR